MFFPLNKVKIQMFIPGKDFLPFPSIPANMKRMENISVYPVISTLKTGGF